MKIIAWVLFIAVAVAIALYGLYGNPFKIKCFACGGRGDLKSAIKWFAYDTIIHYYHQKCFIDVISNPEKHGNRVVDIALEVDEILSAENAKEAHNKKEREKALRVAKRRRI